MAGVVQEGKVFSLLRNAGEEEIKKYQRRIYNTIQDDLGFRDKKFQKAFGLDFRLFHYYMNKAPIYTSKKVAFLERILEKLEKEYPFDPEFNKELEEFICFLKEYGKRSKNTLKEER